MAHDVATSARLEFHGSMGKHCEDPITWTRRFMVSLAGALPDLHATKQRLLQNQVDIDEAITPLYGDAAGQRLTSLRGEHLTTAATLLPTAKHHDTGTSRLRMTRGIANARQILHDANHENWPLHEPLHEMNVLMRDHLDLTLAEAVAPLSRAYQRGSLPPMAFTSMYVVGVIEIFAGLVVALSPRFGGFVVGGWLAGIVVTPLTVDAPRFYDIALRDFGLMLGALALAWLAAAVHARRGQT